jgi:uncharacterized protein YfdQ (DUF2303 family)
MAKAKTGAADTATLVENGGVTEAGAIAALAQQAFAGPQIIRAEDGRAWLLLPEGLTSREITDPHGLIPEPPVRIKQLVELLDKDSLCDYVIRHRTEATVIFSDPFKDTFTAQIDWHEGEQSGFVDHRAVLTLQRSEEWQRWSKINGQLMAQGDFARFLEENAADVSEPSGADLLEVARDLSAKRNVRWKSAIRLDNGDQEFEYAEETEAQSKSARGTIEVPRAFKLRIPIYLNEPSVEIGAFLRWKIAEGGGLAIGIELHRPVFVQQAVFRQIGLDIGERTDRPLWTGRIGAGVSTSV